MRRRISTGSALALAVLALGSTQASACDDDCYRCDGYGYYAASAYYAAPVYYARPAFAYAPPVYYAAPAYTYYTPPASTRLPPPTTRLRPTAIPTPGPTILGAEAMSMPPHNGRPRGNVPTGNVAKRGIYAFAANPGLRGIKAPAPQLQPRESFRLSPPNKRNREAMSRPPATPCKANSLPPPITLGQEAMSARGGRADREPLRRLQLAGIAAA